MSDTNSAHSAPVPSKGMRFHQRRSVEERGRWVRRQERSGQPLKQFCAEHGLALSSFCLWKRQFAQGKARNRSGALVEVPLRAPMRMFGSEAGSREVTIHLPDGTRIEVSAGTDVTWLSGVMHAARRKEPME